MRLALLACTLALASCGREGAPPTLEVSAPASAPDPEHFDPPIPSTGREALPDARSPTTEDPTAPTPRTHPQLPASPPSGASLHGHVVDDLGSPIPEFTIFAESARGLEPISASIEDPEGSFTLTGLQPGAWTVGAFHESTRRLSEIKEIVVRAVEEIPVDFTLPRPSMISGIVVDPSGRGVLAELIGQVARPGIPYDDADWETLATTEPDGTFSLPVLSGSVYLYATAKGFAPSPVLTFLSEPGQSATDRRLQLTQAGTADVTLLDAQGKPAEGLPIRLSDFEYRYDRTETTDEKGQAHFDGLQADSFRLEVMVLVQTENGVHSNLLCDGEFQLDAGGHKAVTLHLPERREVDLTVHLTGSGVREGDWAFLGFSEVDGTRNAPANHARDGSYRARLPSPGLYRARLDVVESDFQWRDQILIPDVPSYELTFRIDAGWISGRVHDRGGTPVPGARITADSSSEGSAGGRGEAVTEPDGSFELRAPPGTYTLGVTTKSPNLAPVELRGVVLTADSRVLGIDIELSEGGTIRGTVARDDGTPVPDALVFFTSAAESTWAKSNPNGAFETSAIQPGEWHAMVAAKDLALTQSVAVQVSAGEEASVNLSLVPGREVSFVVLDGTRQTLEATLEIVGPTRATARPWKQAGLYALEPLPFGSYRAIATLGERTGEVAFTIGKTNIPTPIEVPLE